MFDAKAFDWEVSHLHRTIDDIPADEGTAYAGDLNGWNESCETLKVRDSDGVIKTFNCTDTWNDEDGVWAGMKYATKDRSFFITILNDESFSNPRD